MTAHAIIVQPSGSDLTVGEEYNISNKTQPPVAYYRADGSFIFSLPDGAQLDDVSAVGCVRNARDPDPDRQGKNKSAIAFPFRPGDSGVRISYKLPYPGNQTKLTLRFSLSRSIVSRFSRRPPCRFRATDLRLPGRRRDSTFTCANPSLPILLSRFRFPAPLRSPRTRTPDGAAVGQCTGGDDSQNPSVNSRIETGTRGAAAAQARRRCPHVSIA